MPLYLVELRRQVVRTEVGTVMIEADSIEEAQGAAQDMIDIDTIGDHAEFDTLTETAGEAEVIDAEILIDEPEAMFV